MARKKIPYDCWSDQQFVQIRDHEAKALTHREKRHAPNEQKIKELEKEEQRNIYTRINILVCTANKGL